VSAPRSLARLTATAGALALLLSAPAAARAQDSDGDGVTNAADAFPCDGSLAGVAFAPAEGVYGALLMEDMWPEQGDLDFNDLALAYNLTYRLDAAGRVRALRLILAPTGLGGTHPLGLGLRLPVPAASVAAVTRTVDAGAPQALSPSVADAELTVVVSSDLRELFAGASGPINSLRTLPRQVGSTVTVDVTLASPTALGAGAAPHDLFIFRSNDPGHELHRPEYAGTAAMNAALFGTADDGSTPGRRFVDFQGLPFVLHFPNPVAYPAEGTDVALLYPDVVAFAQSGGALHPDFYLSNVQSAHAYADVAGQPAPTPPAIPVAVPDVSCLPRHNVFDYTGGNQTFTVPAGVTSLQVSMWGAGGGGGAPSRSQLASGGGGGYTAARVAVTPGEVLTIIVGGGGGGSSVRLGGFGGGGDGHPSYNAGAGGGGRSALRRGSLELLTAAGGGGGGYDFAGAPGGGLTGGRNTGDGAGGNGATQSAGGAAVGSATVFGQPGIGQAGSAFQGGYGVYAGGGGGGGYYGGGGAGSISGYGNGGGGGSSFHAGPGVTLGTTSGGAGASPGNASHPDRGTAGQGGQGGTGGPGQSGRPGRVLIDW
jgi:LruC domain-containing protein